MSLNDLMLPHTYIFLFFQIKFMKIIKKYILMTHAISSEKKKLYVVLFWFLIALHMLNMVR